MKVWSPAAEQAEKFADRKKGEPSHKHGPHKHGVTAPS